MYDLYDQIVAEARTWLGTPYHHGGCVKGAGCDCATLLYGVLNACGLIIREDISRFSPDWFAHTQEERYMRLVARHAYKLVEGISYTTLNAQPGMLALSRHSHTAKVYNHGGIVTRWPMVIHAVDPRVEEIDATQHWLWSSRPVVIFDPVAKQQLEHIT